MTSFFHDGTGRFFSLHRTGRCIECFTTGRGGIYIYISRRAVTVLFLFRRDGTRRYFSFLEGAGHVSCLSTWTWHVPLTEAGHANLCDVVGCFRGEKPPFARGRTTAAVAAGPSYSLDRLRRLKNLEAATNPGFHPSLHPKPHEHQV